MSAVSTFRPHAMADLSPECTPRRASADRSEFWGSRPKYRAATPRMSLRSSWATIALLLRPVTHRLDLVAVRIAQERAVVGGVVVAQAGWPVIGAAGGDARVPERVDLAA